MSFSYATTAGFALCSWPKLLAESAIVNGKFYYRKCLIRNVNYGLVI
jgi:hypothetical protein